MRSLSPQTWLLLVTFLYILLAGALTRVAMNAPWLGIEVQAEPGGEVTVRQVHADAPAAGLVAPGDRLHAIGAGDLPQLNLRADDLLEDPDHAADYLQYREFLRRQSQIHARLRQGEVTLELGDHRRVTLQPAPSRPLRSLSPVYGYQLLCAMAGLLVGVAVWTFRRQHVVSAYFGLAGLGLLVSVLPTTLYTGRELALNGELMRALSVTNHLGGAIFIAGLVGMAWNYPARLGRFPADLAAIVLVLLIWLVDTLQLLRSVKLGYWYPLLGVILAGFVMAVFQWRRSRGNPVSRAIISWLLLGTLVGPGIYIGLFLLPIFFNMSPLVSQPASWGFLTLFFIMAAFGVSRYRLFELESIWLKAWGWFFGGVSVILLDLLLVYLLGLDNRMALVLSLAVVGFVYFPLRQMVWGMLPWQPRDDSVMQRLPDLLGLALDYAATRSEAKWAFALYQQFKPLEVRALSEPVKAPCILQDGLAMRIPGFENCSAVELYCAQRGGRLFSKVDLEFAAALRLLFERASASHRAFVRGAYTERVSIARDLHDDVGAALLSLIYRSELPEVSELAREALARMRAIIRSLEAGECLLSEALAEWRSDAIDRCEKAGIPLLWQETESRGELLLDARQQMNLRRLLQETISNIIKHSGASGAAVDIALDGDTLRVTVADDGGGFGPAHEEGSGMAGMRKRVRDLGGSIRWQSAGAAGCSVSWSVPLTNEARAS